MIPMKWILVITMLLMKPVFAAVQVTDMAGREVTFDKVPQRIILGESRYIYALSILDREDPLKRVVGMLADLKQIDHGSYLQFQKKFPHIDDIPNVGHTSADSFSIERVLSLNADLAIFGVEGHGPNARHAHVVDQLQRSGVNVVFIDFRKDPIANTIKSIELLGSVLEQEQRANKFVAFYKEQLARVTDNLPVMDKPPEVFLHSRVGVMDLCCETMVRGMMAAYVDEVGGRNMAVDMIPGHAGVLNLEYLLTSPPDVYVATAVGTPNLISEESSEYPPYVVLGAGVDKDTARGSLQRAIIQSGISELPTIRNNSAYAIWHHFYNSPLNVVAVQVFAKWLYPVRFSDLEPRITMEKLYAEFQSIPLDGIYWVGLVDE